MRVFFVILWTFLAVAAQCATPQLGKDALRKLVKLPTLNFQPNWNYDPENGFTLGSHGEDAAAQIATLRDGLNHDISDAESFAQLGQLYSDSGDLTEATNSWAKAVELYRQRLADQPQDADLLTGLGQALAGEGRPDEAESVLQGAIRIAPREWKCQLELGRLLDSHARADIENLSAQYPETGPSADNLAQAQRRLEEANECFEQAVKLAPSESDVYFRRGLHRSLRSVLLNEIGAAKSEQKNDAPGDHGGFSREALGDLQRASRLSPRDYEMIGGTALFEIYAADARDGQMDWSRFSWNALPDTTQRALREDIARLQNLAQASDRQLAAGALEVLGILQGPILGQSRNCVDNLRRAIALDPSREQAWEVLIFTLAQSHRYPELASACEDRVKAKSTARNHLLLAKAYEKLQQWDDSEEEILEAAKEEPNNFVANLALAAALLRHSDDEDALPQADGWLVRSERLLNDTPPPQRNQQLVIDLTLTRSIYFALTDEVDSARQWAEAVIKRDKNNSLAHDILAAMDY